MWSSTNFLRDYVDQKGDQNEKEDYDEIVEKLSALYGEDWKNKSPEDLMDGRYLKEIQEFLHPKRKMLTSETVSKSTNLHQKPSCLPDSDILLRFM